VYLYQAVCTDMYRLVPISVRDSAFWYIPVRKCRQNKFYKYCLGAYQSDLFGYAKGTGCRPPLCAPVEPKYVPAGHGAQAPEEEPPVQGDFRARANHENYLSHAIHPSPFPPNPTSHMHNMSSQRIISSSRAVVEEHSQRLIYLFPHRVSESH
jgi:hypothetical protein